jgi:hypothetical protein
VTRLPGRLDDRDRQAIELARELREQLAWSLNRRGVITAVLAVSPFVDAAGQPSVLVRMNACAARALLGALGEEGPPRR